MFFQSFHVQDAWEVGGPLMSAKRCFAPCKKTVCFGEQGWVAGLSTNTFTNRVPHKQCALICSLAGWNVLYMTS